MKKSNLIIAVLGVVLLTGCTPKNDRKDTAANSGKPAENTETVAVDNWDFSTDSLLVNREATDSMNITFKLRIDYPQTGHPQLVANARRCIMEEMPITIHSTDNTPQDFETLADRFVEKSKDEMQALIKELGNLESLASSYDGKVTLRENTDKYVTFELNDYIYEGGAHGASRHFLFTLSKISGSKMEWNDIFSQQSQKDLEPIVRKAIVSQYYKNEAPDWDGIFQFALPSQEPGFTPQGLAFHYADYEIDAHAAGLPHCVIPYSEVKDLMTMKAQELIE